MYDMFTFIYMLYHMIFPAYDQACEEGPGLFAHLLTFLSLVMIVTTLPLSLVWVVKVVQVNNWRMDNQMLN